MNKTILFVLLVIIISVLNFILGIKFLSQLKSEFKKNKLKYLLNFDWPRKEYFEENGWKRWLFLMCLIFIEFILLLIIFFEYVL